MKQTLGKQIRRAREQAGITQVELANALGIQQDHISAYETGRVEPLSSRLFEIARALNADHLPLSWWFIPGTDDNTNR